VDRRVKERLIGASILVVIIVLVVPELLSGPKSSPPPPAPLAAPEAIRHLTVDLTTSKPPTNSEPTAASAADEPSAPASVAAEPVPAEPSAPAAISPISAASSPKVDVVRGGWAVQLGSFASRPNADNLVHQLKAQGFSVYVLSGGAGASMRHKVRVGPLTDREAAERTAGKLKSLGHPSSLVAPTALR
jgi:DedD protein